jgi:hypothetical protein
VPVVGSWTGKGIAVMPEVFSCVVQFLVIDNYEKNDFQKRKSLYIIILDKCVFSNSHKLNIRMLTENEVL